MIAPPNGHARRVPGAVLLLVAAALGLATRASAQIEMDTISATVDSVRVPEGDAGITPATFTVQLSRAPDGETVVDWTTQSGTALADSDFIAASGQLVFAANQTVQQFSVQLLGDSTVEGNEVFRVRLSSADPTLVVTHDIGLCTIVNDEKPEFAIAASGLTAFPYGAVAPAFADLDGDGDSDLPVAVNEGWASFAILSSLWGAIYPGEHHGSAWCDYDRDGLPDLMMTPYAADWCPNVPAQLFHNLGGLAFEDVAPQLGMNVIGHGETVVWGDFNGDGWPDLFTPYYAYVTPFRGFFYINRGDGTFIERGLEAGVALEDVPERIKPEGADAVDWNGDGSLDLYCASHLFLNDGAGNFTDVREAVGLPETFDEGSKFVDFDNDGDFDFYLRAVEGPWLFRNDGGHFVDVTASCGFGPRQLSWGDSWVDADNDGDLDMLFSNRDDLSELFLNRGDGTFEPDTIASFSNTEEECLSAWSDVDRDGDLDVVVGQYRQRLFRNLLDRHPGTFASQLRVRVLDAEGYEVCFGATVRLRELGGGPNSIQTRAVDGGSGYLTQSEYPVSFGGLGSAHYSLEVCYPGGPQTWTRVDGAVNPLLGDFTIDRIPLRVVTVYRDGRVDFGPADVAAAPAPRPRMSAAALGPAVPSPARHATAFRVDVAIGRHAVLQVLDVTGRCVRTLPLAAGTARWNLEDSAGGRVPDGVYFATLSVDGRLAGSRRVVVLD